MTTIMISSIVTEMDSTTNKRFVDIRPSAFYAYPEVTEILENLKFAEIEALLGGTFTVQQVRICRSYCSIY